MGTASFGRLAPVGSTLHWTRRYLCQDNRLERYRQDEQVGSPYRFADIWAHNAPDMDGSGEGDWGTPNELDDPIVSHILLVATEPGTFFLHWDRTSRQPSTSCSSALRWESSRRPSRSCPSRVRRCS